MFKKKTPEYYHLQPEDITKILIQIKIYSETSFYHNLVVPINII